MLNERDGGIGGVKVKAEECETGYKAQVGVECYESYRGKNALVHTPNSTGITLTNSSKSSGRRSAYFDNGIWSFSCGKRRNFSLGI